MSAEKLEFLERSKAFWNPAKMEEYDPADVLAWTTQNRIGFLLAIVAAIVAIYGWRVVDKVRARITYPRIGYFRERSEEPSATARGMLIFIGGAFLLMVLSSWLVPVVLGSAHDVHETQSVKELL